MPFAIDPGRAFFALGLALVLYLFAVTETNPETTRRTDIMVPVEVVNRPARLAVVEPPPPVQLRVRAPLDVFNRLRPESFVAQVDASGAQAGEVELEVNIRAFDPDVREVIAVPPRVRLRLEEIQERLVPVRVNTVGQVPSGYLLGLPRPDPARITVSGPASATRRAVEVVVDVNVDRLTVSVNGAFTPRVLDDRANELRDLTLRPSSVNVEIPITQQAQFKEVGVRPNIVGRPAPGYFIEPVLVDPPTVTLVGEPSVLEAVNFVETAPIDANGLQSPAVRRVSLAPPANVALVQPGQTVLVTIPVSPLIITQTLRVTPSVLNLPENLVVDRPPDPVDLTISGPAPTLSNLTARDFRVVVDLSARTPGRYLVEPRIQNLPPAMTLDRMEPRLVAVELRDGPTPSPVPTPPQPS